jgi:signal transduction histidine kinase
MIAMVGWWTLFMANAVQIEQTVALSQLQVQAHRSAITLGQQQLAPQLEDTKHLDAMVLLPCKEANTEAVALVPHHPATCIQVQERVLNQIQERLTRRNDMVLGEGLFLFLLLAICSFMLYTLIAEKQRHADRMESFFHAATHEMKTPLTGIKTLLETLRAGRVPDSERDQLLSLGLSGCHQLEHRIENVLIAGGLQAGQQKVNLSPTTLAPFLAAFIDHRLHTLAGRSEDVRLSTPCDPELHIQVDPDLLRVVLENLVDNGLKYGGEKPVVEIAVAQCEEIVGIAVSDSGIGFESAVQEAIFTPYRRALSDGHKVQHGTGLGLSIARDLCRKMGGDLVAMSHGKNQGATFTVTLQAAPTETA